MKHPKNKNISSTIKLNTDLDKFHNAGLFKEKVERTKDALITCKFPDSFFPKQK